MTTITHQLDRCRRLLGGRLEALEERLKGGDESAWGDYLVTAATLAAVAEQVVPGRHGELLTTAEMAARLSVAHKALLKRKGRGEIRPAIQRGKLIRWRGDEVLR